MKRLLIAASALLAALGGAASGAVEGLRVERLRCEYEVDPLGIDDVRPRLSWVVESEERDQQQGAYRILVASSRELLSEGRGDFWDSGKVESSETVGVGYGGEALGSRAQCHWKVRVWDRQGRQSAWSEAGRWTMGLLEEGDWRGQWLDDGRGLPAADEGFYEDDPAGLFRKEFRCEAEVRRAMLYITGVGFYEARLNGEKVGEQVLDPAWTTYDKRVLYSVFDVTGQVREGGNCMGVTVGNGWWNPLPMRMWGWLNLREHLATGRPCFVAQLEVELADGSRQVVASDGSWRWSEGPIVRNNVYLGEVYDARREQEGWDEAGFDDSSWGTVNLAGEVPQGRLRRQMCPPVKAFGAIEPVGLTEPAPGVFVFDMGRNLAGWVRLTVEGPRGQRVRLRYGELLDPNGQVNVLTAVCGQIKRPGIGGPGAPEVAEQADTYILRGGGPESYTQTFTFRAFRYVEVTGYPGRPTVESLQAVPLHAELETAGEFRCSNEMFNRVQEMCRNTFLSNVFGVQSDCPGREKFGYGGDLVGCSGAMLYNFDMGAYYTKCVEDFADAAYPSGALTNTAPDVGITHASIPGDVGWGLAHPYLQWRMYEFYGDGGLLEGQYGATRAWIEYLLGRREGVDEFTTWADHEAIEYPPADLCSNAQFFYNVELAARIAEVLGKEEAQAYRRLADEVREGFAGRFGQGDSGLYGPGNQSCQSFALHYGLVRPGDREAALGALVRDIEEHGGKLTTGIFTTGYMLDVLTREGLGEVAYGVVNQREFPGWGYMLENGATTLWEHWAGSDDVYSQNHPMFGSVSEWFFAGLAGIRPGADGPGFGEVVIAPTVVDGLDWVEASYESVRGPIVSRWRREGGTVSYEVEIPANARGRFCLPTSEADAVMESGRPAGEAAGVRSVVLDGDVVVYELGSGAYRFRAPARR